MDFAGLSASRTGRPLLSTNAWILLVKPPRDLPIDWRWFLVAQGSMLMHSDNRGVDHLDSGIVTSGKCVYDAAPDTSPPPADETVIASGIRAERLRQIAPWRARPQDPENAVKNTTVVYPRNAARLVGQHWVDGSPFMVREFVAHDSTP